MKYEKDIDKVEIVIMCNGKWKEKWGWKLCNVPGSKDIWLVELTMKKELNKLKIWYKVKRWNIKKIWKMMNKEENDEKWGEKNVMKCTVEGWERKWIIKT